MTHDSDHVTVAGATEPATPIDPPVEESAPGPAPWWRHMGVVAVLGLLPMVKLGFCGLIAMVILFSDQRRHPYTRLGGTLVIGWWTFTWARNGIPPLLGLGLLGAAAAAYVVAARARRHDRPALLRNGTLALVTGVLAALNVAPWGARSATINEDEAIRRAVAASAGRVRATHAQAAASRTRLTQRPQYLVLLFEPNATTAKTLDGEPCFRRAHLQFVDGVDGTVDRRDFLHRLVPISRWSPVSEAREKDGYCLPLPRGTHKDIVPLPTAG